LSNFFVLQYKSGKIWTSKLLHVSLPLHPVYNRLQLLHKPAILRSFLMTIVGCISRGDEMSTGLLWTTLSHGVSGTICSSTWQRRRKNNRPHESKVAGCCEMVFCWICSGPYFFFQRNVLENVEDDNRWEPPTHGQ